MKHNELVIGAEITTTYGKGTLTRIKPGNFRNQNYEVTYPTGNTHWFTFQQLQYAYKLATAV